MPERLWQYAAAAFTTSAHSDVVDSHFALYAFVPRFLPRLRRMPWMVHFQGPWAAENVVAGNRSAVAFWARNRLERAVYSRADVIVTLTSAFRQTLCEQYRVPPWNVRVIPPGVDANRFADIDRASARQRLGVDDGTFVVCCVRRLTPRMGHTVLLDAWQEVVSNNPHVHLFIPGVGELREQLEQEIAQASLSDFVTMLGGITDAELADLYRAADLNVVPTLALEGFGLIVLEAAAAGTPSLVTRVGGLPEAVSGLGDDLVVEPGDARALSRRLLAAIGGQIPSRTHTAEWIQERSLEQLAVVHQAIQRELVRPALTQRRPRIVYLDHQAALGPNQVTLLRLLRATQDVEVHVLLAEDGPLVGRLNESGISVEVLPLRKEISNSTPTDRRARSGGVARLLWYSLRISRRLREINPDVIYVNSATAGAYGTVASRLTRTRLIWNQHERLTTRPRPFPWLIRALRSRADAVIVESETLAPELPQGGRQFVLAGADRDAPESVAAGHGRVYAAVLE